MKKEFYKKVIILIGVGIFSLALLSPSINYKIGNIFFGKIPKLYNLTLANFFFVESAYPIFGNAYPYAHYQLSRTYFIKGRLDTALSEAEKELKLYPENTRTYYILGLTYGYMNREKEAIEAFSKFIELYPDTWAGRNDKAWLQFRIGDIDGALETIKPMANLENPWIQNTYGTILMNKKRYKEARTAFNLAKKLADNMTESSWGYAYPGNDPRIYWTGLMAMKNSIENNLKLLEGK